MKIARYQIAALPCPGRSEDPDISFVINIKQPALIAREVHGLGQGNRTLRLQSCRIEKLCDKASWSRGRRSRLGGFGRSGAAVTTTIWVASGVTETDNKFREELISRVSCKVESTE